MRIINLIFFDEKNCFKSIVIKRKCQATLPHAPVVQQTSLPSPTQVRESLHCKRSPSSKRRFFTLTSTTILRTSNTGTLSFQRSWFDLCPRLGLWQRTNGANSACSSHSGGSTTLSTAQSPTFCSSAARGLISKKSCMQWN